MVVQTVLCLLAAATGAGRCGYQVCGDRAGAETMVAGTRRVRVSYLRERVGMGAMDCTRAALYFEAG